jgi:hypothetical protein
LFFLSRQGAALQDDRAFFSLWRVCPPWSFVRWCRGSGFVACVPFPFPFFFFCVLTMLVSRIVIESKRLDQEEQDAEELFRAEREAFAQAQRRLDESLARLDRIRRQKRSLLTKGTVMVQRGLASLDEVEEVERQESSAVMEAQASAAVDVIDWNAVLGVLPELSSPGDPDFFGGTVVTSQGSGGA